MIKKCVGFLFLTLLLPVAHAGAQELRAEITNVELKSENEAVITYNLTGDAKDEVEIEVVLLSDDDSEFELELTTVSGDVGRGKFTGDGKTIKWNFGVDFPKAATGRQYKFKLVVSKVSSSGMPWYVYAAGSVVVSGLAVLLTRTEKEEIPPPPPKTIPLPPARWYQQP